MTHNHKETKFRLSIEGHICTTVIITALLTRQPCHGSTGTMRNR